MTGHTNAVDGTVVGAVVQAATVHGGVHVHQAAPAPPRQLIAPPTIFVGRDAELAALNATDASPVILTGPGGVGKTTLARRWAHDLSSRYPDGQLYLDLQGYSESTAVDPGEALGVLLRAVGVPSERVPATVAEQSARFRSLTAGRALLVVLDNAFSAAQVRVLLPGAGPSLVLVTSRWRLAGLVIDGGAEIEVRPWNEDDAVALLERSLGAERIDRERAEARALARICGGLPLALSVVAARLAARSKHPLARLAAELGEESHRLAGLRTVDGVSVRGSLDLSYHGLDAAVRAVYRRLAVLPGRDHGPGVVAAVGGSAERASAAIDRLLQANLLEEPETDRFRQHDLLLLHAQHRLDADESPAARDGARRAGIEWYLAAAAAADRAITPYRRRPLRYEYAGAPVALPSFTRPGEPVGWLDHERPNLLAAGRMALAYGWNDLAWHLSDVLWPLFLYRTHRRDRIAADERGVTAARCWGNRWAEADMRKRLGDAYAGNGRESEAEDQLHLAVAAFRDAGDPLGVIDAEERLASLYRDTGREPEAVRMYRRLLAANRATGDPRRTALTLVRLGGVLTATGAPAEAVDHLVEARAIFGELGDADPYNRQRTEIALARAYLAQHETAEAAETAAGAAAGMRGLGSPFEEAQALEVLARAVRLGGDAAGADAHAARASRLYAGLGLPGPDGVEGEGGAAH
ncbi:tetratricopeptide repeat protein [Jidongwangia harbinensis]|uniref:tetratricopeptide repeat protein n=1 Tax=Jidongwangia harbinensis TaxID=2878561 RepID=UPI001CD9FD43|nr:tetratricopeptide repeat protein [Jidongwangia harbinensis]MCA2211438.1 hypothetical protein [Jidongwangia harbinensis]